MTEPMTEKDCLEFGKEVEALAVKYKSDVVLAVTLRGNVATNTLVIPKKLDAGLLVDVLENVIRFLLREPGPARVISHTKFGELDV